MTESEDALVIRHVAERLMKAYPHLDAALVTASVATAYEELRYARVRTICPY
ncbi:three-helix bundle dimerization domain-containing protein [Streptomyces sp. NPDC012746]|uniref:three-helix bundle dimerization domain-containing protein n=1 Tax=Streptomyces sp. NPDC012746 TaxID=3364845 RepID=UPI0036BC07DB